MTGKRIDVNVSNLIDLYNFGKSVKALSEIFEVSRDVITRRLKEVGIMPRNRSESMFLRMSQTSAEERISLTQKAHETVRGSHRSFKELCNRAKSIERSYKRFVTETELLCAELIRSHLPNIAIVHQKAIGPYNVDLALPEHNIAVEVFGGGWHGSGRHFSRFRERINYLSDSGWFIIVIWVDGRNSPLGNSAVGFVISCVDKVSNGEAFVDKYRMIWGNGKPFRSMKFSQSLSRT
ncbi:MAG: hypothetical protein R2685_12855 [Candidatus Nitrosocosmicus sp.]|nr:hypothetical protein [Candidatus Nitrosocosmicus sp.]